MDIKSILINYSALFKRKLKSAAGAIAAVAFKTFPMQNRAYFLSHRNSRLEGSMAAVFDKLNAEKNFYAGPATTNQLSIYYHLLTSKVIVVDDYTPALFKLKLRKGQKVFQLWHAAGAFKKFSQGLFEEFNAHDAKYHAQYTCVCVSSEHVRQFYADAFALDINKIIATGTPSTDELFDKSKIEKNKNEFFARHPDLNEKKLFLYLPTFRGQQGVIEKFEPVKDWGTVSRNLNGDEALIISRHMNEKQPFFSGEISGIYDLTNEPTHNLMAACSAVITDYSSVIFDAAILNKPITFFCPDFENYDRGFYLDFERDLPGELVKDESELIDAVRRSLKRENEQKLIAFKQEQLGACNGHSAETVAQLIKASMFN